MDPDNIIKAMIFDISRFALHDGPGIRTTVFFKGCPLRCIWCQNPESMNGRPEIIYYEDRCIRCGRCAQVCPVTIKDGPISKTECLGCGRCSDACMTGARKLAGRLFSPDDLLREVVKDTAFYKRSGGGITLSGGEPMMQADFIQIFAGLCKTAGLHVAVDTCGYAPWSSFEKILPAVDLFLYDLKVMNPRLHKEYTGVGNGLVLDNAAKLAQMCKDIIIRVPLIPGYTDTVDNMVQIARFIREKMLGRIRRLELLPFNTLAGAKYGMSSVYVDGGYGKFILEGVQMQDREQLTRLKNVFIDSNIPVYCETM
jgi:pyruvate formate lyase activating enzyme